MPQSFSELSPDVQHPSMLQVLRLARRIDIRHPIRHHEAMAKAKDRMKKLTILVPENLLRKATEATRAGVTPTVRMGLKLLAARRAYDRLLGLQGKVRFSLTWQEMRGEQ